MCVAVNVIKTHVTSLQEEVVKLLTQQQLEDGVQLRLQALPGDGGQECLLRGRQVTNGGQTLGRGVQPPPTSKTGSEADPRLVESGSLPLLSDLRSFLSPGGHHADVCGGDDRQARETSLPPGTLHRGQVHQVQLKLWVRAGRQHPTDPSGEPLPWTLCPHVHVMKVLTSTVRPSGLQPLHLRALGPPADRGGHPGGGGSVHGPADPHREGQRLWRWKPGYGSGVYGQTPGA